MYKRLSFVLSLFGILLFLITYMYNEQGGLKYIIESNSESPFLYLSFNASQFRIIIVVYFFLLILISYLFHYKHYTISKKHFIKSNFFLVSPIYFYAFSIQNALDASEIWSTLLPFYHYPQSYMDIITHYMRFMIFLFCINFIYLIYFCFYPFINKKKIHAQTHS